MLYKLFSIVFYKQKTAYEMRISDWSSDVCSSDLEIDDRCRKDTLEDGELKRGIPLYRQLIGRYGGENLVEFAPHRCAIKRLDGLETSRFDARHHRSEGRRQRNDEAGAARDLAVGKQLLDRPIGFERRRRIAQRRDDRITRRDRLPGVEIDLNGDRKSTRLNTSH